MHAVLQKPAVTTTRGRLDPQAFHAHIDFHTFAPPAYLELYVEHFWVIRTRHGQPYTSEQVMHKPYVDFFLSDQQSGIQGTFRDKRVYSAAANCRIIGIRFRPGAFHAFYHSPLTRLLDTVSDPQELLSSMSCQHIQQLLKQDDQTIFEELARGLRALQPVPDPNIELLNNLIDAIELDESMKTVSGIAKSIGKSERWLQQFFQEYVGVGLKWFLQRKRLLAAAETIRNGVDDWAALGYDAGYSSQQHFISDFK